MNFYLLIFTAASVSIDSLIVGTAVGASLERDLQKTALTIISVVGAMCVAACALGLAVGNSLAENAPRIGGLILFSVGIFGLLPSAESPVFVRFRRDNKYLKAILLGLGVGADGACACLSLSLLGYGYTAALAVILFHYLFLEVGMALAEFRFFAALGKIKISQIILMCLGLLKVFGL